MVLLELHHFHYELDEDSKVPTIACMCRKTKDLALDLCLFYREEGERKRFALLLSWNGR